jgi:hypothetical protein
MGVPVKNIEDFIGVYDGWLPDEVCDKAIDLFKDLDHAKQSYTRLDQSKDFTSENRKDVSVDLEFKEVKTWPNLIHPLIPNFMNAVNDYLKHVPLKHYEGYLNLTFNAIKIQKTLPGEGFHVWHQEASCSLINKTRVIAYTIYLNDVEEGGETEFLYQSKRVQAKKGRIVIWPAGFPYAHRGNPPLSGEKYIMTSWLSGEFNLS